MRGLEHQIYMTVLIHKDMSLKEIQSSLLNIPERTVIRAVNGLVESGKLEHKRIHGKGKRKRYTVEEEKTRNDITIRAFPEKTWKKGLSVDEILATQIRLKITATSLSASTSNGRWQNGRLLADGRSTTCGSGFTSMRLMSATSGDRSRLRSTSRNCGRCSEST